MASTKGMNFRECFKRPLTPAPSFLENHVAIEITDIFQRRIAPRVVPRLWGNAHTKEARQGQVMMAIMVMMTMIMSKILDDHGGGDVVDV